MHRLLPPLMVFSVVGLLFTACGVVRPGDTARTGSVGSTPTYADTAEFRTAAQSVVNAFAGEIAEARKSSVGAPPVVVVRNTPQLIFFSKSTNGITIPWWSTTPPEMRTLFRTFAGGGEAEAEALFKAVFNRFLIAHEAAHWFQAAAGRQQPTPYENENAANRLAVAFWRTQPGGEVFLAHLEMLTTRAAEALADPTPQGQDPVVYFGANYQTLGAAPLKYGYYQFRFMRDAIRDRSRLKFSEMVK